MQIIFSTRANTDLVSIAEHIALDNLCAAIELTDAILDKLKNQLLAHPNSGRPGRVEGTRELVVHRSYVVAYRVSLRNIEILTIRHASRLWPEKF